MYVCAQLPAVGKWWVECGKSPKPPIQNKILKLSHIACKKSVSNTFIMMTLPRKWRHREGAPLFDDKRFGGTVWGGKCEIQSEGETKRSWSGRPLERINTIAQYESDPCSFCSLMIIIFIEKMKHEKNKIWRSLNFHLISELIFNMHFFAWYIKVHFFVTDGWNRS